MEEEEKMSDIISEGKSESIKMMRIVCISDTHGKHRSMKIPDGDVLIHAGDLTPRGHEKDIKDVNEWLGTLPHKHKIMIAGNHDFQFEINPVNARSWITNAHYLCDESLTLDGVKFYGSPWQPRFFDWAFNKDRGAPLKAIWDKIPLDTDVLITHGPPHGILDLTFDKIKAGCEELLLAVQRIKPKVHVFGHIHE